MSSSRSIKGITFAELRHGLEAGHIGFSKVPSKRARDFGTLRVFLTDRRFAGNIRLLLGNVVKPAEETCRVLVQPLTSKNAKTDNLLRILLGVPEEEHADMRVCIDLLLALAAKDCLFGPTCDTKDKVKEVWNLPFQEQDDGTGAVWAKLQIVAPPGMDRVTQFVVLRHVPITDPETGAEGVTVENTKKVFDGRRLIRGQNVCAVLEMGEVREYGGKRYLDAEALCVTVDESQSDPNPDAAPSSGRKPVLAIPYDGGFVLFGNSKYPVPEWVAADADMTGVMVIPDAVELGRRMTSGRVTLEAVPVPAGKNHIDYIKHPAGSMRYFMNDKEFKGNLYSREGDFDAPEEAQTYLARKPERHKDSAVTVTSYGAMFAILSLDTIQAYRSINETVMAKVWDLGVANTGNKRPSMEVLKERVKLPGLEPDLTNASELPGEKAQNYCLWEKFQMEPVNGLVELQTQFYQLSQPGMPFVAEKQDGYGMRAGMRPVTVFEWSEMKKDLSAWRIVLYSKYVFYLPDTAPETITWGAVTVPLEPASSKRARIEE